MQAHRRGRAEKGNSRREIRPPPTRPGQQPHIYKKQKARREGEEERAAKRRDKDERTERRAAIWVD